MRPNVVLPLGMRPGAPGPTSAHQCVHSPTGDDPSGLRSFLPNVTRPLRRCDRRPPGRCRCRRRRRSSCRRAWPGAVILRCCRHRPTSSGGLLPRWRSRREKTDVPCRHGFPAPRLRTGSVAPTRRHAPTRRGDSAGRNSEASSDSRGHGRWHLGRRAAGTVRERSGDGPGWVRVPVPSEFVDGNEDRQDNPHEQGGQADANIVGQTAEEQNGH